MLAGLLLAPLLGAALLVTATPAGADASAYELYCPGTPVGNVVLNNVVVTGSLSPPNPAAGQQFSVTNFQVQANVPSSLASAAQALGNTSISGNAVVQLDATGATPGTLKSSALNFSEPLPPSGQSVPASGIALNVPSPAGSIGPFTASGGAVTVAVDKAATLTLEVSGSPLTLTCTAYPNNSVASGITKAAPTAASVSPTVATASGGSASGAGTPTTAAPATAAGSSLPTTGPTTDLYIAGIVGLLLIDLGYLLLTTVARPRRLMRMLSRAGRHR